MNRHRNTFATQAEEKKMDDSYGKVDKRGRETEDELLKVSCMLAPTVHIPVGECPELPRTQAGWIDVTDFTQHELGPRCFPSDVAALCREIRSGAGLTRSVKVKITSAGPVVLSGYHVVLACAAESVAAVEPELVKVVQPRNRVDELRVILEDCRWGRMDKLAVGRILAILHYELDLSIDRIACVSGITAGQARRLIERYDLAAIVAIQRPDSVQDVGKLSRRAVVSILQCDEGLLPELVSAAVAPSQYLDEKCDSDLNSSKAHDRWGKSMMAGPEVALLVDLLPKDVEGREAVTTALLEVLEHSEGENQPQSSSDTSPLSPLDAPCDMHTAYRQTLEELREISLRSDRVEKTLDTNQLTAEQARTVRSRLSTLCKDLTGLIGS